MKDDNGHKTLESMSQAVWYNRWTLKQFKKFLMGDILEVGCGIGTFSKDLTRYGKVVGTDIDKQNLKQAKKVKNVKVGYGDIEMAKYFFNNRHFDTVVCLNVLEHIKNDNQSLINIYKLLKTGGHLILLVPFHPDLYGEIDKSIGHFRRYTKESLQRSLNSSGLKIVRIRVVNFLGGIGWFLAGRVLKNKIVGKNKIGIFNLIAPLVLPLEELIEPPLGTSILVIAKK
ncbi:hypothetical protein A3C32_04200 [Candidatus Daviesbacteria bacterium RIFCSPHIGHO2_02_FULL_41_14]|uniref:Methyltransferase type 11 domain-containing protein n=1 Tax=Candidatus Daviesbacteria bacterium RIFCSPLOWO2_01_FULL_40_24 TaxID=1797787 RepID=A0A1F5MJ97_9BACT|nr:MAG: hypothetical protein A3C32_04200 [Candidatus Daviesbacteria bacterium RIFCSPHIGHO2_02_FULL_41_14]OGE65428.1 MAG: hypothetical protein A3B49_00895 [Candidatus Daviesbacteria bacterium RIFCSPLOWO2_01_FULL_40_24]